MAEAQIIEIPRTKTAFEFLKHAKSFGLKPEDLCREFTIGDHKFIIVGMAAGNKSNVEVEWEGMPDSVLLPHMWVLEAFAGKTPEGSVEMLNEIVEKSKIGNK